MVKDNSLEIQIVEEEINPFRELLDFINAEIYPRMSKKDVEEIKSGGGIAGSLVQAILKYHRLEQEKTVNRVNELNKIHLDSLRDLVKSLGGSEDEKAKRYRTRNDNYVGD